MWSLGVLAFEALTGNLPFKGKNRQELLDKMTKNQIDWPKDDHNLSESSIDLISKLLKGSPKERINAKELRFHRFFAKINWDTLHELKSPFTFSSEEEAIIPQCCLANHFDFRKVVAWKMIILLGK